MRFRLGNCPRCGGDLRADRYWAQRYEQCIQCGYLSFLESMATPASHLSRKVKESPTWFDGPDHGVTDEVDTPAEALRGKGLGSN
ncbi:MAG: hypothetical protein FJ012_07630 [Chloroflexi bacterium]|nr:hypothetical protein [Chloroflexota bacterium]